MTNLSEIKKTMDGGAPKILFHAADKFGKSTFASQAPNPIFIDMDHRLTYIDCAKVKCKSYIDVIMLIQDLLTQEHEFKTVVIDSGGTIEQHISKLVADCYNAGITDKNKHVKSAGAIPYGAGTPEVLQHWNNLLRGLQELNTKKNMVIIILCHTTYIEWETDSVKYSKYVPDLHGKSDKAGNLVNLTTKWVDVTLYGRVEEYQEATEQKMGGVKNIAGSYGDRVLWTGNNPKYVASNSFKLPDVLPFNEGKAWNDFYTLINKKD